VLFCIVMPSPSSPETSTLVQPYDSRGSPQRDFEYSHALSDEDEPTDAEAELKGGDERGTLSAGKLPTNPFPMSTEEETEATEGGLSSLSLLDIFSLLSSPAKVRAPSKEKEVTGAGDERGTLSAEEPPTTAFPVPTEVEVEMKGEGVGDECRSRSAEEPPATPLPPLAHRTKRSHNAVRGRNFLRAFSRSYALARLSFDLPSPHRAACSRHKTTNLTPFNPTPHTENPKP